MAGSLKKLAAKQRNQGLNEIEMPHGVEKELQGKQVDSPSDQGVCCPVREQAADGAALSHCDACIGDTGVA